MTRWLAVSMLLVTACSAPGTSTEVDPAATPTQPGSEALDKARIADWEVEIVGSVLRARRGSMLNSVDLDTHVPCRIHRDRAGGVRTLNVNNKTVFLIECSVETQRSPDGLKRSCDTTIRGVLVTPEIVALSPKSQHVGACLPFEWDEKVFRYFGE